MNYVQYGKITESMIILFYRKITLSSVFLFALIISVSGIQAQLADKVRFEDLRNISTSPNLYDKILHPTLKQSSVIGLPLTGYNFTSLIGFRGWGIDGTGGNAHELGFIDNGRIYYRTGTGTSWQSWQRIITEGSNGSVGDLVTSDLLINGVNIQPANNFPKGIQITSATGYWQHQARALIGLDKRNVNTPGINNDITDKVGIWIKGYYTEYGGSIPVYLGGSGNGDFKMLIESDGRVAIGTRTTSPGYKLFVEEGIRTRKVQVDQATWPDFVFSPDYKLLSLKEVQTFIAENKHLPEMPSAKQVEEDGLNLGDNQARLLQKIEELTLYAIDQENKIDLLQLQIQDLKKAISLLQVGQER